MSIIKKIIWGIILLYLQVIFAGKFEIVGIVPNFLIAYAVFIAVFLPAEVVFPWIFLLGIAYDLTYPTLLGINTISFLIIAFIVKSLYLNVNKGRFSVVLMSLFLMNLIHYLIFTFYYLISAEMIRHSLVHIFFAIIFNTLLSVMMIYLLTVLDRIKINLDV